MALQKSTLALGLMAILLTGGVVILEGQRGEQEEGMTLTEGEGRSPVFALEEGAVQTIRIETAGAAVAFERDGEGRWQMTAPETGPAEEAAIAFLLSRLTADGLVRELTFEGRDRDSFGLEVPAATVELTLRDGQTHRLIVGDRDFSGQGVYALVDPAQFPVPQTADPIPLALLNQDVLTALNRPLGEWQAGNSPPAAPEGLPSFDSPPIPTPAETLPLPPAPEVEGNAQDAP